MKVQWRMLLQRLAERLGFVPLRREVKREPVLEPREHGRSAARVWKCASLGEVFNAFAAELSGAVEEALLNGSYGRR